MNLRFRVNAVDLLNVHFTVFESGMDCGTLVMCRSAFIELVEALHASKHGVSVSSDDPRFDLDELGRLA
jgi:hypothetical protein